ncbi:MAG TPA: mechanosensitive ion channel domain-containing protein, partial [Halococcus sp.]|nr:mechanosensitive ion channel domain-containing protein [Halococcus sp.]
MDFTRAMARALFAARFESGFSQTNVTVGNGTTNTTNTTGNNSSIPLKDTTSNAVGFLDKVLPGWIPDGTIEFAVAIAVLVIAWYVSKLVVRLLSRRVARRFRRPSVTRTVLASIQAFIMFFAVLAAVGVYGVSIGNIFLSVTVLAAAVGVVLAPIIGNIISGLFVLADQPYEIGDMVEIVDSEQRGFVENITLRHTKISTTNNAVLTIPNETIRERDVINYSTEDERTRLQLDVLVTYEGDLAEARALCEQAARDVDMVISGGPAIRIGSARYPAEPTCYINTYADNGVLLSLRYWVKNPYNALDPPFTVPSAIRENIWD